MCRKENTDDGYWVAHSCRADCGGRCLNYSFISNGTVIRQKTDDTHPDSPDYPQQRGCARGRAISQWVLGSDRMKYPLKRKHWEPGGGDKSLRGQDEWIRISWDEALGIVASEIKRIAGKHGNKSILATTYLDDRVSNLYTGSVLNAYGGCVTRWGQQSQGACPVVANKMKGSWSLGALDANDRFQIRNSKLIVLWAVNTAWSSPGNPTYHFLQAKKAGAKFIVVDPFHSPTAQVLADQWIPVRPGTDTALLLGVAYHIIINKLQDQAFLNSYTVGFDADHMPEGAAPEENFKDYVLGTYDGIPKTPEWASEICGTDPDTIRGFAIEIATTKPMAFKSSMAPARTYRGGNFVQAFYTVGWMTGNVGVPGAEVTIGSGVGSSVFGGPPLVAEGSTGIKLPANPICTQPRGDGLLQFGKYDQNKFYGIAYAETWDAIINEEYTDFTHNKRPINIQMIWKIGRGNRLNQAPNFLKGVEAYRKVEFAVASDLFMTADCQYSDIVLPVASMWERWGNIQSVKLANREIILLSSQVIEPMFECKDDLWIEMEIAKRLDIDPLIVNPIPWKQAVFNQIAGSKVIKENGSGFEPLVTITKEDLTEHEVTGEPQVGRIPFKEFKKKGIYQVPRSSNDMFDFVAYKDYRENPIDNPLPTNSGKFEIHCELLVEAYRNFNFTSIAPIAKYEHVLEGFEDTFHDFKNNIKGDYPFQLISVHYLRTSHSTYDNVTSLRKIFPNELMVNSMDACKLGLQNGDTVLVTSRHGKVLRRIIITPCVMPGVTILGQGAWTTLDENNIDKAGNTNVLTGSILCGEGHVPYNTVNIRIEKWTGKALEPDYKWPKNIV